MDTTPLGALKKLCRQKPAIREELYRLSDEKKSVEWRAAVRERFGISLLSDSQVTRWRAWAESLMREELRNDRMERFEEWLHKRNPNLTREQVREAGIDYFMEEAAANGDRTGFVEILDRDRAERIGKTRATENSRKLDLSERRVKMLEEQADRARKAISDPTLTAEQQRQVLREILK